MNKTLTDEPDMPLLEAVEWCIEHGNCGPRTRATLVAVRALLAAQQPEPRDAIERSKRILGLVDSYHDNPTQHTRTALRAALIDEFQREPRAEVMALIEAAEHVVSADRACALDDSDINALAAAINAARAGDTS
ncbi:hypothetical protein BLA14095_00484 [Burkholderia lata]|uniref:hypothetical protein n=1 Tax=Burkholderia lata (strain ATCC 17760 / DSM 23089 / LMG 22485 / NCIMB 9086 / R18194 / 383) TaxID=482957 RepID=UPI0014543780|nr:hypothetical protein [Burkholderia lata]VWB16561.1 hypothetical protein BLA14095_00484 [Burkholderia lata]